MTQLSQLHSLLHLCSEALFAPIPETRGRRPESDGPAMSPVPQVSRVRGRAKEIENGPSVLRWISCLVGAVRNFHLTKPPPSRTELHGNFKTEEEAD